jgi:AraC-like DNA-binding protein
MGRMQLYLPRDSLGEIRAAMDMAVGATVDGPRGALLADYMLMLGRNLPNIGPEEAARLPAAVQAMVGACLAPSRDRMAGAMRQIELTLMERVRRAVRRNLRSPSLGPDRLCREAAMSRSQLYRVLEGEGGAAAYIQRCRLAESFTILCDSSNDLAVGRVAELLCFADASTFSRAFRREFGLSPSEARNAALSGCPLAPAPKTMTMGERSYGDWLRA